MKKTVVLIFSMMIFLLPALAQNDSLILSNNNTIIGEVKTMNRGILTIETDYSDSDFKVEWDGIQEIYTTTYFLITTTDGSRYNGHLASVESGRVAIVTETGQEIEVDINDIVFLDDVDKGFWSQVYASIDVGIDMTKSNNFKQVSIRSTLGYLAERWTLNGSYNTLGSTQDEVEDISRTDGGLGFKYFLPKDWYPLVSVNFLSSTEQKLNLRSTLKSGLGKYVIHTNRTYWGFSLGVNYNNENYSDTTLDRRSWEGFFGSELNMFNVGDLSMATKLFAYPSFTESGRWRADFNFDLKYDLPLDFYIKLGITYNYDNQPIDGATKDDYVFHTGFGWEW